MYFLYISTTSSPLGCPFYEIALKSTEPSAPLLGLFIGENTWIVPSSLMGQYFQELLTFYTKCHWCRSPAIGSPRVSYRTLQKLELVCILCTPFWRAKTAFTFQWNFMLLLLEILWSEDCFPYISLFKKICIWHRERERELASKKGCVLIHSCITPRPHACFGLDMNHPHMRFWHVKGGIFSHWATVPR